MKRQPRAEEVRLWSVVTATVRPGPGRKQPVAPAETAPEPEPKALKPFAPAAHQNHKVVAPPQKQMGMTPPTDIEPGRKRRLTRERDPIDLRLDLHGLDQDRAKATLAAFLRRAQDDGLRAVLVITGKGYHGDGILRRRTPDWLAEPGLRSVVAGVSEAHRRHGGEGALYVALKRKPA